MKAITLIDEALSRFQFESGMVPRVILLPWRIFRQYEREANLLESVLPANDRDDGDWADVRVVEHESIQSVEVY